MSRILLLIALLIPTTLSARDFNSNADIREFTDKVMKQVSSGDLNGGLSLISDAYTIVPKAELEALKGQAMLQVPVMESRFGKNIGYEFLSESSAGKSVLKFVYLQKFEKHAIVWHFVFYKPKDKWLMNSFNYSDSILNEL